MRDPDPARHGRRDALHVLCDAKCERITAVRATCARWKSFTDWLATAEGSALIKVGNTHVLCAATDRGHGAAVSAQRRQRLGDGGVFDAAARHRAPDAARGHQRPASRADPRNPAADRALHARRGGHGGAGRAHRHHRLRRAAGRRRHAHRLHHRGIRGAGAGGAANCGSTAPIKTNPAARLRGRHQRGNRGRRPDAGPLLRGRLAGRRGHERGDDRARASSSRCRPPPSIPRSTMRRWRR